ncbi:MAG TPA: GNAT family N-acetyltransferase [Roseiflexaceae bacterium]|nr:GNAT family N-acetyltransferase [Roseiflexaceae bacterium]
MTLTIRPAAPSDLPAADNILMAAFQPSQSRLRALAQILSLQPDGILIAEQDGAPAGLVSAVDYGPFAYIGMMAVRPDMHRRGIARSLMERLLDWLDARSCPMALLDASESGAPLYAQLGFVEDEQTNLYLNDDCAPRTGLPGRVAPLRPDDLPSLVALDARLFGTERTALLELLLRAHPGRGFLARGDDGQPVGYLVAQEQLIGPWVAADPAAAASLLAAALTLDYNGSPYVQISSLNADGAQLLLRHGFSPRNRLRHMRRGGIPRDRSRVYGQTSFSLG